MKLSPKHDDRNSARSSSALDVMRRLLQAKNVMASTYSGTFTGQVCPFKFHVLASDLMASEE